MRTIAVSVSILSVLLPLTTLAVGTLPPGSLPIPNNVQNVADLEATITAIANVIFAIFLTVTVLAVLIGAFRYLTAGGDPARLQGAHNTLIYAGVAIVVALLARALPTVLTSFIGQ